MLKILKPVVALVALIFLAVSIPAYADEPAAEDVENAKTPTNILKLLPKDEKDWPKPFGVVMTIGADRGADARFHLAWSIVREKKEVVIQMHLGEGSNIMSRRLVYDQAGELKSFHATEASRSSTSTLSGKVVGDDFVVTRTRSYKDPEQESSSREYKTPLKEFNETHTLDLMPLIAGYHVRNASLGYSFRLSMLMRRPDVFGLLNAEDVGTEQVEVDGKKQDVHVLIVKAYPGDSKQGEPLNEERAIKMSCKFLKDGGFVSMMIQQEGEKITAKRAAYKEVLGILSPSKEDK